MPDALDTLITLLRAIRVIPGEDWQVVDAGLRELQTARQAHRSELRTTHTYAILQVSQRTYQEIRSKLEAAGYADRFDREDDGEVIDLSGIALQEGRASEPGVTPDTGTA